MSNMKVGSSPLYYIQGQEDQLENFTQHLNQREKEAFFLLKEKELLKDEDQTPVIRVALRAIKDFAIPLKIRVNNEVKLFWRYFQFPESELKNKVQPFLKPQKKEPLKKIVPKQEKHLTSPQIKKEIEIEPKPTKIENDKPVKPQIQSDFSNLIKDYLGAKDIEILEELSIKKKEYLAKIRIDIPFGKQEFLLTAKDKKKITQDDLTIAIQNSQTQKMPSLFISPGELDKKAQLHIKEWRNLIKFEKIKL